MEPDRVTAGVPTVSERKISTLLSEKKEKRRGEYRDLIELLAKAQPRSRLSPRRATMVGVENKIAAFTSLPKTSLDGRGLK